MIFTNYGFRQYRERTMALGADYFFDKARDFDALRAAVDGAGRESGRPLGRCRKRRTPHARAADGRARVRHRTLDPSSTRIPVHSMATTFERAAAVKSSPSLAHRITALVRDAAALRAITSSLHVSTRTARRSASPRYSRRPCRIRSSPSRRGSRSSRAPSCGRRTTA
jgi:hypothetical protein